MSAEMLTHATLASAVDELTARDADLAVVVARWGPPPMWERPPGFATLAHIVLEQQVSLASARAAFERLRAVADPLTPERFLELDDAELLGIGFSRQKTRYVRLLAHAIATGALDLDGLARLDDQGARAALVSLAGVGPWTASIYLLMALRRPDVWPEGDLALASAVAHVKRLTRRPSARELAAMAVAWQPWRAVAARLFWHDYLRRRERA